MGGLEFLIIGLCMGEYKCSTATEAYYKSRPEMQRSVNTIKRRARSYMGGPLFVTVSAATAMLTEKEYKLRLAGNCHLAIRENQIMALYSRSF